MASFDDFLKEFKNKKASDIPMERPVHDTSLLDALDLGGTQATDNSPLTPEQLAASSQPESVADNQLAAQSANNKMLGIPEVTTPYKDDSASKVDNPEKSTAYVDNLKKLGLSPDNYVQAPSAETDLGLSPAIDKNNNTEDPNKSDADFYKQGGVGDPITALNKLKSMAGGQSAGGSKVAPTNNTTPPTASAAPIDLSDKEFQAAQDDVNRRRMMAGLLSSGEEIGRGIAGLGAGTELATPKSSVIKGLVDSENNPITDLAAKRKANTEMLTLQDEKDKMDPNSSISKAYRDFAKNDLGVEVPPNASASQLKLLEPLYQKHSDNMQRSEDRKLQYANMAQNREIMLGARQQALQDKMTDKQKLDTDKYVEKITGNARGAEQFKNLNARMNGVGQAMALIAAHTKNGISSLRPAEMTELNLELARILTGSGIVHESTMKSIDPKTGPKAFAQMMESVTGGTYDVANLDEQIKRIKHNLSNQYGQAEKQIRSAGSAIARGDKDKQNALEAYLQDQRDTNGVGPILQSNKLVSGKVSVIAPDGTVIPMNSEAAAQAFIKDHPEVKLKR